MKYLSVVLVILCILYGGYLIFNGTPESAVGKWLGTDALTRKTVTSSVSARVIEVDGAKYVVVVGTQAVAICPAINQ